MIDNRPLRDAAGNTAVRNPSRSFLLSPGEYVSRPMRGLLTWSAQLWGVPEQWTYGGGAVSGTTGAVGS